VYQTPFFAFDGGSTFLPDRRAHTHSIPDSETNIQWKNIMSNASKTVVITGVSSGIGLGLAEAFLKEGYNVVGLARSSERLQAAAAHLNAGEHFLAVSGDVGKPESARLAFEKAFAKFGKVDVLVNNAGIFAPKPFIQFSPEEMEEQISTNLKGVLFASQIAAKHMIERKSGKIINITASLGILPQGSVPSLFAVTLKGGVNQATKALALELAPYGITVNAVAPGIIDTPMHQPQNHEALAKLHPLGRIGRVDEVNDAVLYLTKAEFVTGVVLPVDGGFSAGR
jgi:NAD(P)-dependent dehydrogenase (short-subunit alcohol dehydrogenase family)